jgi:hypothetical protein
MIGGTVVNTEEFKDKIRIDVVCDHYKDKCSVYVELTAAARCIERDSSVWWHGDFILWTPKSRAFRDYQIKKIGNSFTTKEKDVNA